MSADALVRRGALTTAARAWLRPLPLVFAAIAIAGDVGIAAASRLLPAVRDKQAAQAGLALAIALIDGFAAAAIGFTWKRHVCRPQARLAPGYRDAHATCALVGLIALAALGGACLTAGCAAVGGIAALAAVAAALLPVAIGGFAPFSALLTMLLGPAMAAVGFAFAAEPVQRVITDSLAGRRIDALVATLAIGGAITAFGAYRAQAIDEDDVAYHVQMSFGPPPAEAVRDNPVLRAMRAWDRRARGARAIAPVAPATMAWALHRSRLFIVAPWPATLVGDALILGAMSLVPERDVAINTALALVMLAPTTVFARLLVPGFAAARAIEALRPASRARDVASMLFAMLLAQARAIALTAIVAGACIALRAPTRIGGVAVAVAAAALVAPLLASSALAIATVRGDGRRQAALGGLFAAAILVATTVQFAGAQPGWICAAAALAGIVVVPLAWRRLIRIDIG